MANFLLINLLLYRIFNLNSILLILIDKKSDTEIWLKFDLAIKLIAFKTPPSIFDPRICFDIELKESFLSFITFEYL